MKKKLLLWKIVAIWGLFMLIHFSYDTFPNTFFFILGEIEETAYTHMKMLFFAYIFASIIEFFVRREKITGIQSFVLSRMLVATVYPWVTIHLWYSCEALGLHIPSVVGEIIYANIVTIAGLYFAVRLDEVLEGIAYRPSLRNLIVIFFLNSLFHYIVFSYNPPSHFFNEPDWWSK